jgi:hypothetical protein
MSEASLERGYRRLLAWYPRGFRAEQGDEMLAVLMAGAGEDQRRPGLLETLDVLRSAVWMRLRSLRAGPENRGWADGLALFSVLAPVFLVAVSVLEAAIPYHLWLRPAHQLPPLFLANIKIGGLSLFSLPGFRVAIIGQVLVAGLALLGLRRLTLIAMAGTVVWLFAIHSWFPYPLQLLTTSVYLLEAAALTVSPGPRHGRHLMNWGHGVVLLLAAGAVEASTLWYESSTGIARLVQGRAPLSLLVIGLVLVAVTVAAAVAMRVNWYLLLLLAVMAYPYVLQLVYPSNSSNDDLIGHPTPLHLALLYLPPLLVSGGAVAFAVWRHLAGAQAPADEVRPA